MLSNFGFAALNLPGTIDPSVAIAAARCGALGVLNLEYACDETIACRALAMLDHHAPRSYGVRLGANTPRFSDAIVAALGTKVGVVILTDGGGRYQIAAMRRAGRQVLLQVTSAEAAREASDLGVDGLVAKGHEAGGLVGDETSFVLLQHLLAATRLPVWVHGGIGLHTAAACCQGGAAGVVLDAQLALCRESLLSSPARGCLERMDGSETICVGADLGQSLRFYHRRDFAAAVALVRLAGELTSDRSDTDSDRAAISGSTVGDAWRSAISAHVGWDTPDRHVWLLGQDGAFAAPLAAKFRTVAGVLEAMHDSVTTSLRVARARKPLEEGSLLARSNRTRYPIVAGPMTRVSDRPAFALAIAKAGALPFLALALMRAQDVEALLRETKSALGTMSWGVGILGFVPSELRQEQLEVIRAHRPDFALIAGGRPDQAIALERDGIPTYIHVPSPALLAMFLESGVRRFVFEGRECGGHVGPRSSFVLWNSMIDVLLERLPPAELAQTHVLFAGGIHDSVSAAMVATAAAPLADRGAAIGVLLGTAYLFTSEAVNTGAITAGFQRTALACQRTSLLETGVGHETRCANTAFVRLFERERQRLLAERRPPEEIRIALEELNLGRLRIAAKGTARNLGDGKERGAAKLNELTDDQQRQEGMYMMGQVAALRSETYSMAQLHHDVSTRSTALLVDAHERPAASCRSEVPNDIAIIGMGCILPKAPNLRTYWTNIVAKLDAISEIPAERWDWKRYFDPDPAAPDRIYSRWGGFLDDVPFDPTRYGIPPNALRSIEPLQLLTLEVVREALEDAGYSERPFARDRTAVILGVGGGVADLGQQYAVRSGLPMFVDSIPPDVLARLPKWTEESFPGILLNVAAGRVANRFDLGGVNYTVDAACASSLAAVYLATRELEAGTSDMVIVGGADTVQNPLGYLCFSKTHALSPRGRCHTFDEHADGIAISEGLAVLVLKRLPDAERDGDRIHAVIKGVGGSSDGRDRSLTAPSSEGQVRALERAYAKAGISPSSVTLVEAHGTGTVAGDQAEVAALKRVFCSAGAKRQTCALGSVKSMIGHTKCTAGVAGLVKVALALRHKVLPPTINVSQPNAKAEFAQSPFYLNTEVRPWIHPVTEHPRRAAVSAFGFGGTNFHVVLEEYTRDFLPPQTDTPFSNELMLFGGTSTVEILSLVARLEAQLAAGAAPALADLAWTLWQRARSSSLRLAIVTDSLQDLGGKLAAARALLETEPARIHDPRGIYFVAHSEPTARVAFLFPGQGSQRIDMLIDLGVHFPEVRERFELADRTLAKQIPEGLSRHVYPPPRFGPDEASSCERTLIRTEIAQPAIGAANMGMFRLLESLGVRPDMLAGHSYGEYVALCCAGVFSEELLYELSEARGRCIAAATEKDAGTMAAVSESAVRLRAELSSAEGVWVANVNAPRQTVISGTKQGIGDALEHLAAIGIRGSPIQVACAFHSPLVAAARDRFGAKLAAVKFAPPRLPVYANASARPYPRKRKAIAAQLVEHLVSPVEFMAQIEAMYEAGARVFVEVGPRNVLTGLTEQILAGRPHIAIALDVPGRPGIAQLSHALGQLAAWHVPLDLDRLYAMRPVRSLNLDRLADDTRAGPLAPGTWLVSGGRAKPSGEAPILVAKPNRETFVPQRVNESEATHDPHAEIAVPLRTTVGATTQTVSAPEAPQGGSTATEGTAVLDGSDPAAVMASESRPDQVIFAFQRLMQQFLQTQQQVMISYLARATDGGAVAAALNGPLPPSNAEAASPSRAHAREVPTQPPTVDARHPDAEAPTRMKLMLPVQAGAETSAASVAMTHGSDVRNLVVETIAAKTGYPADVLRDTNNLESDLGISSIARIEILGTLERRLEGIGLVADAAGTIKTLADLTEFVQARYSASGLAADATTQPAPAQRPDGGRRDADTVALHNSNLVPAGPSSGAQTSRGAIAEKLLSIVGERTGYPPEMLDPSRDIESDLGISSIARVEILGTLQRAFFPADPQGRASGMGRLSSLKTLDAIADAVAEMLALDHQRAEVPPKPANAIARVPEPAAGKSGVATGLPRFVPAAEEAVTPEDDRPMPLRMPCGIVLITDDGRGVARTLAEELGTRSVRAVIVGEAAPGTEPSAGRYEANFASGDSLMQMLNLVREREGPIAGIVHLLPLRSGAGMAELTLDAWRARLSEEVTSLFHLAKGVATELRQIDGSERGWLVAATPMGGGFAHAPEADEFFPGHGGLAGMMKTLAVEWPHVRVRLVDVERGLDPHEVAGQVLDAVSRPEGEVEIGWRRMRCLRSRLRHAPLEDRAAPQVTLDANSVLLVTGGARGITAEIACELAERFRPTLVLVGRSAFPDAEPVETEGISDPKALKAVLIERMRDSGASVSLPEVDATYRRLCHDREMRRNLAAMQRAGATVRYLQLDVRDGAAFASLIDGIYQQYGRIDGVVHGAGTIEDRLVTDKDAASFNRVFDTKTISAFVLARRLRPKSLSFLALFSSVSGRFGNAGQSDYAAANEVINKLAVHLDREWPGRVVAINWGPWKSGGMVSPEVQLRFTQMGVELIEPAAGRRMLIAELLYGRKGEPEVVLGGGPWPLASAPRGLLEHEALKGVQTFADAKRRMELERTLDPAHDASADLRMAGS